MQIQDLKWITHTHTDCYDVCKIYDGEMPSKLWGDQFWENHYYLINSEYKSKKEELKLSGNFFYYEDYLFYPLRLLNILSNINSEMIVLDHEDMILYDKANLDEINKALILIEKKNLDSIRFIKNINAKYNKIENSQVEIIDKKSEWIFSIQPSIWRRNSLISVLKRNLNVNIWQLEYKSQKVVRKLGLNIGVLGGDGKKRGKFHCDSEYYPFIATALFKGKWTISEYPEELKNLFAKYKIDPLIRGGI
tara:strand:- start:1308 stop:2054 length:747 start_codon:yes stop_codon:yes gene_type:complete